MDAVPNADTNVGLDQRFTKEELYTAIRDFKQGKAVGADGIPIEVLLAMIRKDSGTTEEAILDVLLAEFNATLETGALAQSHKDVILVPIFKKGDTRECGNYRGIALMNHVGKLLERMMLNRLQPHFEAVGAIPDTQCGFRKGVGTTEAALLSSQVSSYAIAHNMPLYKAYIDLTKAYDTVDRDLLWEVLSRQGVPPRLLALIRQFHVGAQAAVRIDGALSRQFELRRGLKQGSILSPLLFNVFLGTIIKALRTQFAQDPDAGIALKVNSLGRRLIPSDIRDENSILRYLYEILYADDCQIIGSTPEGLQRMLDLLVEALEAFGLEISIKKTKIMIVRRKTATYVDISTLTKVQAIAQCQAANIATGGKSLEALREELVQHRRSDAASFLDTFIFSVKNQILEQVTSFCYLGRYESETNMVLTDLICIRMRMMAAYRKFRTSVFENPNLFLSTRIKLFTETMLGVGLFAGAAWNARKSDIDSIESMHFRLLRRMVPGATRLSSREEVIVLAAAHGVAIVPIAFRLATIQVAAAGKIESLPANSIHHQTAHGKAAVGTPAQGRPPTDIKAALKASLRTTGIEIAHWEETVGQGKTALKQSMIDYLPFYMDGMLTDRDTPERRERYAARRLVEAANTEQSSTGPVVPDPPDVESRNNPREWEESEPTIAVGQLEGEAVPDVLAQIANAGFDSKADGRQPGEPDPAAQEGLAVGVVGEHNSDTAESQARTARNQGKDLIL